MSSLALVRQHTTLLVRVVVKRGFVVIGGNDFRSPVVVVVKRGFVVVGGNDFGSLLPPSTKHQPRLVDYFGSAIVLVHV
jgi:hypothetical protein